MILDILKTKQLIKEAVNPFVPGTWLISMDIGYSSVAAVSPNKLLSIPLNVRNESADTPSNDNAIRFKAPDGTIYDVGARYPPDDKEYIPDRGYWEQVDKLRVLMETVLGISFLDSDTRAYSGETIRTVCCLPAEYEESSNFTVLKTMLEGNHIFGLLMPETADWIQFDFTVSSAVIMPKDSANSFFGLYSNKTAYSDIINCNPPVFQGSIGLYLHYCKHYS